MGYIEIDTLLPNDPAVSQLSDKEFWELITSALRFNQSANPDDFPEKYDEFLYLFKFHHAGRRRKWNREHIWARFGGVCHLCGEQVTFDRFHIEHIVPLARGGKDTLDNINIAHPSCNLRKGAKLVEELA